jgi:catechol 2,3-dioxygenase-like lactoylglutathione lyase family enzyme
MIKYIRHCGLVVSDINRANEFYSTVLGLNMYKNGLLEGKYVKNLLGLDKLKIAKYTTEYNSIVELYEIPEYKNNSEFHHISFSVCNIETIQKRLEKHKLSCSLIEIDEENKHKVMFCRDFDNNLIELVETIK